MRPETPVLKSRQFRTEREADWRKLEGLLEIVESGRREELSDDEVISLPVLYRSALSSLSVARSVSLDQSLIAYLEGLSTRAYFCVYGARSRLIERMARFFTFDWRSAVRSLWVETLVASSLMLLGTAASFLLTRGSPDWFYSFIPEALAEGRDPSAATKSLRDMLFSSHQGDGLAVFSSALFTHNAEVALLAFALGIACCLPTGLLMIYNGLMLGALLAVYFDHGLGLEFGAWILIHGVTELFAVALAGAAGFKIGWALAFPRERTRAAALAQAGRLAALVMIGVVVMLGIAGLLEGFGRQLITSTILRYSIAAATGVFWLWFFYLSRGLPRERS